MVAASVIILEWICPTLGVIIANIMFIGESYEVVPCPQQFSLSLSLTRTKVHSVLTHTSIFAIYNTAPVKAVRQAVTRGHLGDLNPTPWVFMLGNCVGWITYSFLLQNLFIFFANAPGFLIAIWLNLCAAKLQYQTHRTNEIRQSLVLLVNQERNKLSQSFNKSNNDDDNNDNEMEPPPTFILGDLAKLVLQVTTQEISAPAPHEYMVVGMMLLWTTVISVVGFVSILDSHTRQLIIGIIVNINVLFFYGAPLSSILTVLRSKSSNSIHIPTMMTNTLNAVFWTAYGVAVLDPFLYLPNGTGAFFGGCQIILLILFPRSQVKDVKDYDNGVQVEIANNSDQELIPNSINTEPVDVESGH
jgi:solute carrier family 50 (sugar transporter)